jgi:hypothetical protein
VAEATVVTLPLPEAGELVGVDIPAIASVGAAATAVTILTGTAVSVGKVVAFITMPGFFTETPTAGVPQALAVSIAVRINPAALSLLIVKAGTVIGACCLLRATDLNRWNIIVLVIQCD